MNSWVLNLPDREYASKLTVLVGDLETCTVMSGKDKVDKSQLATCQSEIGSRVLEQCSHCASWNGWLQSQAWAIRRPREGPQRYCHAGSLTWQLEPPASCCGRGAVSAQRGVELLSAESTVPKIVRPMGRAAKNLGNNVS
jgi:hypothetical protein